MTWFMQAVRNGLRMSCKQPGCPAVGVFNLQLEAGMTTFSMVESMRLRSPTFPSRSRVVSETASRQDLTYLNAVPAVASNGPTFGLMLATPRYE
jgi:metal-sulfur cluster biosynthetic enzyme